MSAHVLSQDKYSDGQSEFLLAYLSNLTTRIASTMCVDEAKPPNWKDLYRTDQTNIR